MALSILMVVMTLHLTPTETLAAASTKFANLVLYVSFSDSGVDYWNDKGKIYTGFITQQDDMIPYQ